MTKKTTKPLRTWKELKQKQKSRITDVMYRETDSFSGENGHMPESEEEIRQIAHRVYIRVASYRVPYDGIELEYRRKLPHIVERLETRGMPTHLLPREAPVSGAESQNQSKKKARKKKVHLELPLEPEQDDTFFCIMGYTSGGAPYGVTWDEMGLEPWQSLEDLDPDLDSLEDQVDLNDW